MFSLQINVRIITALIFVFVDLVAAQVTAPDTLRELMRRIDILAQEVEKSKLGEVSERTYESRFGMGPAASQVYQLKKSGLSLAGYGEVLYQNFSSTNDAGAAIAQKDEIDYLRHVVYLGFRFSERLLFNSEMEVEHASTGKKGEVAMEFGYLEVQLASAVHARAGMLLVPVGIINELHEPPTFPGALRPETESVIIPTTWRANGFGVVGAMRSGLGYKFYVVEALDLSGFSAAGIRGGRQSGSKSVAENFGFSGRLDYSGVPGLNLGVSFFSGKGGQSLREPSGEEINTRVTVLAAHGILTRGALELRALLAQCLVDNAGRLNRALGRSGEQSIGSTQRGYYLTAAYDFLPVLARSSDQSLAPFVQFELVDTQAEVPEGFWRSLATKRTNVTYGLVYKPLPNVALKFDYVDRRNLASSGVDQFNVAINYMF